MDKVSIKSLEELENDFWPVPPSGGSRMTIVCYNLRKKPLKDFSIEDFRVLIGQNIGLAYLIPEVMKILANNFLAEGDYYEGDLLHNVLRSDRKYWHENPQNKRKIIDLFEAKREEIASASLTDDIKIEILQAFEIFKN